MQTILVLNSKGGCGKTTIATNLAGYYAAAGMKTALMDYDPQGSSLQWLSVRGHDLPAIHGIDASRTKLGLTRTWQTAVPLGTERLVIDAPAGVCGQTLQDMARRSNVIVVPVAPSAIDIHATSEFMCDLLLIGKIRKFGIRVCVVANRVRRHSPHYEPLKCFLNSLKIPFVTSIADSENYLVAAESGVGVHEMNVDETHLERGQWTPLIDWLAKPAQASQRHGRNAGVSEVSAAGA